MEFSPAKQDKSLLLGVHILEQCVCLGGRLYLLCVLRLNARQNRFTPVTRPWLAEFEWQQMSGRGELWNECG